MRVAVIIPCRNEAQTIGDVILSARDVLPGADIVVGENNCTDETASLARKAGARVISEHRPGKAHMVRRLLREVSADLYVMVDGDATYDLSGLPVILSRMRAERLDLINVVRNPTDTSAMRPGHAWGNKALTNTVVWIFGRGVPDMLSGYKVLSSRFVRSFPVLSTGFDLETDMAVHALECGLAVGQAATPYLPRPEGSFSKLSTWRDGWKIGKTILALIRHERPMLFFGAIASALAALSVGLALPVIHTYLMTGLVPRLPTAVLSTGLMLAAGGALLAGLIGEGVTRARREMRMLACLSTNAPVRERVLDAAARTAPLAEEI